MLLEQLSSLKNRQQQGSQGFHFRDRDSFCCLRSLIFGQKKLNRFLKGAMDAMKAYQVLWFGGGATHAH